MIKKGQVIIMYNVLKDSLIAPKNLLKYRNKPKWFVFLYFLLLTAFVSIGTFVYYFKLPSPSLITSGETSCAYSGSQLVCSGADYDPSQEYLLYDYSTYFINADQPISALGTLPVQAMVFSGSSVTFYVNGSSVSSIDLTGIINDYAFDGVVIFLGKIILTMSLILAFLGNVVMLLFVAFISTLPFMRLKKFIPFKKIFKLVIFAISPFAVLMTFYNLINFDDLIFFVLMLVAYRSVFVLQKELFFQTYQHIGPMGGSGPVDPNQSDESDITDETEISVKNSKNQDDSEED